VERVTNVSELQSFNVSMFQGFGGFETSSLNPFSVEKGLINERF
jgi:hypothetical protein